MDCDKYSSLMSLKIDGALDEANNKTVEAHVQGCPACSVLWLAMLEADVLMWKWVAEPLPVPANFQQKVMLKIDETAAVQRAPSYDWSGTIANVTRPLTGPLPGPLTAQMQGWQRRASGYVRGVAIAAASVAASVGLLLLLLFTGVIQFEGPLASLVTTLRTYLGAVDTWVRSVFLTVGTGVYAAVGLVMLLLALVGWQIIAQYQRSVGDVRGNTGYLEAAS